MKKLEKFVVIESEGCFLQAYKNNPFSLSYEAEWIDGIQGALLVPFEKFVQVKDKYKKLAELFEGRLLLIETEHNITDLDGNEATIEEPEEDEELKFKLELLKTLLG